MRGGLYTLGSSYLLLLMNNTARWANLAVALLPAGHMLGTTSAVLSATAKGQRLPTLFTLAAGSCPGIDTCRWCELRRFIRCGSTTTKCQTNSLSNRLRAPACLILSPSSHILQNGSLSGSVGDAVLQQPRSHAAYGAHGCSSDVRQRAGCACPMCLFPSHSSTGLLTMVAIWLQFIKAYHKSMDIACEAEMNLGWRSRFQRRKSLKLWHAVAQNCCQKDNLENDKFKNTQADLLLIRPQCSPLYHP